MSRVAGSARALAGVAGAAVLLGCWRLVRPRNRKLERLIWRMLRFGFRIDVQCHGDRRNGSGTLYVANHVSWADIVVLGELIDGAFVAKDDVERWPLVGAAARRIGCLFVSRGRRGEAVHQARSLDDCLAGNSLVLFAEGTTGLGRGILPFRSSLFAAAQGRIVQPLSLCWRRRDGVPFSPDEQRNFAWIDDDALFPNLLQLAKSGGARVDVYFEIPVLAADRKSAARACEVAIADRLAKIAGPVQAATLKRAA